MCSHGRKSTGLLARGRAGVLEGAGTPLAVSAGAYSFSASLTSSHFAVSA